MSKNEEIAGFLRQRMVAEMKRFHEFADNMNGRAYYGPTMVAAYLFNSRTAPQTSICYGLRIGRTLSTLHKHFAPNVQRSVKTN